MRHARLVVLTFLILAMVCGLLGSGYTNLHYFPLRDQRMAATRTEFVVSEKAA